MLHIMSEFLLILLFLILNGPDFSMRESSTKVDWFERLATDWQFDLNFH